VPTFPDVKPWPNQKPEPAPAGVGHNRPPLDEAILADFVEALGHELLTRIDDLANRGLNADAPQDDGEAGRYGDFIAMCREAEKAVEAERERHNRPLLTAQRSLKGRADGILAPLQRAAAHVRAKLDAYIRAKEVAERAASADNQHAIAAPAPAIRGDYGAKVGTTTVWLHEIESLRQLPDSILRHEKVVAALNQVIGQQVRSGTRQIDGVRIWSEQRAAVR
jgi:hypothetical protein